jgi:single-strand DNA-binding protein
MILLGNCGKDPEIRETASGRMATFSLATSETWKDKVTGDKKTSTEWHNIVVYNDNLINLTEKYIRRGSKLYIDGKFKTSTYEKDGVEKKSIKVELGYGGVIELLPSKKEDSYD